MKHIKLNDILHLTEDEIKRGKLFLTMHEPDINRYHEDSNEPCEKYVGFSYYSHQGGKRNLKENSYVVGFIRLNSKDTWLLVTVGTVTKVPSKDNPSPCEYERDTRFDSLLGRLVVKYNKGNAFSRYAFNLDAKLDELEVSEILPNNYEYLRFNGFENIHLNFSNLQAIIETERFQEYRAMLQSVKGIYCLTDTKTGKLYIGSAYGENGVAQRWDSYIKSSTGGNKELINLYKEKGKDYFKTNFTFTLIEYFPKSFSTSYIVERENYWKIALCSKEYGYNDN